MSSKRRPRRKELGVSDAEYERLLASQAGRCALCGHPPKTRRLDVDHDHRSGFVRGLLCPRCNRALGLVEKFGFGSEWLAAAIEYRVPGAQVTVVL